MGGSKGVESNQDNLATCLTFSENRFKESYFRKKIYIQNIETKTTARTCEFCRVPRPSWWCM